MAKNLSRCSFKSPIFSSSSSIPFIKNGLNEGHKQLSKKKQTKDVKKIYQKKKIAIILRIRLVIKKN